MDLLDDFLSETSAVNAPANRYKPKAKPRPAKGSSGAAKATSGQPVKPAAEDSTSDQLAQPNDVIDKQLDAPISSSCTENETSGTKEKSSSEGAVIEDQPIDVNLNEGVEEMTDSGVSKSSEDGSLSIDDSLGLQSSENNIGQSTVEDNVHLGIRTLNDSSALNTEEISTLPEISFASASPFRPCTQMAPALSMPSTYEDSGYYKEATINSEAGELWINIEEGAEGFSCLDGGDIMGEAATPAGQRPVKFQPKPKTQTGRKKDVMEPSSEDQHMLGGGSIYAGEPYTSSTPSDANLDCSFSLDPTTTQPNDVVFEDADAWMAQNLPEKCGEQEESMATDALNTPNKSPDEGAGLLDSEINANGCEINDKSHDNVNIEACDQGAASEGENGQGKETRRKKRPRKCKKVASENDESGRKKGKVAKVSDKSSVVPPKKVPRAPRRKRTVNKALLEAPEDELDLQKVSIRDLIIFADYKERQAKKNAAAVQPSVENERTDNTLPEEPYEDHGGNRWNYDQDEDHGNPWNYDRDEDEDAYNDNNPSTTVVKEDTNYFNYHSFMDKSKTTKVRWSKAETELFYQGIREFGSDFLMIQMFHFPGRTRHQVKLKYKKEERENPEKLNAALNSRSKDLSHFEILAQRLQKEAALRESENQTSDEDDPTSPAGEQEWLDNDATTKSHAAKPGEEEGAVADEVPETAGNGNPAKSCDDDEDDFNWDDYKSGF